MNRENPATVILVPRKAKIYTVSSIRIPFYISILCALKTGIFSESKMPVRRDFMVTRV